MEVSERSLTSVRHAQCDRDLSRLRGLQHEGLCPILDAFELGGRFALVFPFLVGTSLDEKVATSGPLPTSRVREVALAVCAVLRLLHEQTPPLLHRHICPFNLLEQTDGTIVLTWFGLPQGVTSESMAYAAPESNGISPGPTEDTTQRGTTDRLLGDANRSQLVHRGRPLSGAGSRMVRSQAAGWCSRQVSPAPASGCGWLADGSGSTYPGPAPSTCSSGQESRGDRTGRLRSAPLRPH
ncbi:MAG: protein kinase domain-containing protein [Candidatus Xenobia bacterium]